MVTEGVMLAAELRRLNWALEAFVRAASAMAHAGDPAELMRDICEAIVANDAYAVAWLGWVGTGPEQPIEIAAAAGKSAAYADGLRLVTAGLRPEDYGPTARALRSGSPRVMRDALVDPDFAPWRKRAMHFGLRSSVTVPLTTGGRVTGALAVYATEPDAFGPDELRTFETLATNVNIAFSAANSRVRLEASLAEARTWEARFRMYFEGTPIAAFVSDGNACIVAANAAAEALFGYSLAEFRQMRVMLLHPPEDAAMVGAAFGELLREGQLHGQFRMQRSDGALFSALLSCTVLPDGGTFGYFQDVEALEQAERRAESLETRFRSYFESAPFAMLVTDAAQRLQDANPAALALFGYSAEQICRMRVPELARLDEAAKVLDCFVRLQNDSRMVDEFRLLRADGTEFLGIVTATGMPDGRFLAFFEDVDDRRRTEAQLLQAQRLAALGEMMTGLAHELNQPLTTINMAAQNAMFALKMPEGAPRVATKLQTIIEQSGRASEIVSNARRFGRTEAGHVQSTPVDEALSGALTLVQHRLALGSIVLNRDLAQGLPEVMISRVQLQQVLTNLLINACDADGEAPAALPRDIRIQARAVGADVVIAVSDQAGGVPPALLPRIFEPFFTTKTEAKGTGLGLSISHSIVATAGGSLTAANIGGGARFAVRLPARAAL